MTHAAYLYRRVQRFQHHRGLQDQMLLWHAQWHLAEHVRTKVAPSFTDTVWRSKRDGGPYRLDVA